MSPVSESPVLIQRRSALCLITLKRPAALNSFTAATHALPLPAPDAAGEVASAFRAKRALVFKGR